MKFFIKTFGCIQNTADSEKIRVFYFEKGGKEVDGWKEADLVIINTCIVRESAENRAYGLIDEINKHNRRENKKCKIIVTGCLSGLAHNDKSGKKLKQLKRDFPSVSDFLPIEKISVKINTLAEEKEVALIPISFGCNNFCSYCIVPFARGREISRKMEEVLREVDKAIERGSKKVLLIGQNVNSYGSDLNEASVVSMGKKRFKSLFPQLLEKIAQKKLDKISFVSSNPWDFSDELIEVIAKYKNIDRLIHLPFQAGDDEVLKKMNRGYSKKEYLDLIKKIKRKIPGVKFSTDIIIGFPGEDEKAFQNTVDVCKKVKFDIAYINKYSPRKGTVSAKLYKDEISQSEKKRRWNILNDLINKNNYLLEPSQVQLQ
jgi:tRNA-2-methylthio-N6-dimethylallyladenosine synthase